MTAVLTAVLLFPIGPLFQADRVPGGMTVEEGILSQYAVGVMPDVVMARQSWEQLPMDLAGIDGFVADWDCDNIGRTALLSIDGLPWVTVMVADCSGHQSTTDWMQQNDVIFEISGELAEAHDVVCRCPVPGEVIWIE